MDNFREWISDNLRYILLGLAIILVLVVAFFAVKLVSKLNDDSVPQETQSETGSITGETESESKKETEAANKLVENDQKILETVQAYYNARSNKDIDTLTAMVENLSEEDKQKILNNSVIESYNNIATYSKNGPVDGSYVVYAYYEAKMAGLDTDTLAPGVGCLYLCTKEDGSLYIADKDKDSSVTEFITNMNSDEDVKALFKSVDEKYAQVLESDEALKAMLEEQGSPETEIVLPDSSEVGVQTNKVVRAADVCNVRADSREDSEVIGMLEAGETVTRVQKLDNGWSEIRYMEATGYVRSDLLTEESADSSESASE